MSLNMSYVWELVKAGLISFRDTNVDLVRFESLGLAFGAGLFIALVLVYKLLWGRNKFSHIVSGHRIPKEDQQGKLTKFIFLIPKILLGMVVFFLLVSLANPYLPRTTIEKVVESRERIDLIDVSASKGWEFENTDKSAGQLGREAFLKFLNMRRGQNDRTSLWLFASESHLLEGFIIDDDIYIMQAEDAPYVMLYSSHPGLTENDPEDNVMDIIAPRDRIQFDIEGGSTNLNPALDAVIAYFDREGNKKIRRKALLIETDAAVEADAESQLRELQKRNIQVYLLHMKPNTIGESQFANLKGIEYAALLKKMVQQFGGKVYDIQDSRSLENAYRDINRLETAPISLVRNLFKVLIFQRPLMVAFMLLCVAVGIGSLLQIFGENP
ncbi:MAG: VWA domain-containing protein [Candidatus Yanofskybacteria bacterium]|nr:VWA domain-containing protein [Candidatus Yanofskybacteria bacterium]